MADSNETSDVKAESLPICPRLETKTKKLNTEFRRDPWHDRADCDTQIFWCTKTMAPWGPDEDDAEPERCTPGRCCFEPLT